MLILFCYAVVIVLLSISLAIEVLPISGEVELLIRWSGSCARHSYPEFLFIGFVGLFFFYPALILAYVWYYLYLGLTKITSSLRRTECTLSK